MSGAAPANDIATTGIVRTLAVAFAVGALLFGLLALPSIVAQSAVFAPWWSVATLLLVFGTPVMMGVVAKWSSWRTLRTVAAVLATGYLLALLTLEIALPGGHLATELNTPWLLQVTALGSTAAVVAWRQWMAWVYICALSLLLTADRVLASNSPLVSLAWQDGLYTFMFDAVFAALAIVIIRAGRRLDSAAISARRESRTAAEVLAHSRERARAEALMHDGVLATLLAAGRITVPHSAAISRQADKTLAELEQFRVGTRRQDDLVPRAFTWRQQAITTEIVPDALFSYGLNSEESIPGTVVEAFSEALAEALRNSVMHADTAIRPANRAVHVECASDTTTVTVLDDGRGFNPHTVSTMRLGISVSIVGRMNSVPGGRAFVVSEIGEGSRVQLDWERP